MRKGGVQGIDMTQFRLLLLDLAQSLMSGKRRVAVSIAVNRLCWQVAAERTSTHSEVGLQTQRPDAG